MSTTIPVETLRLEHQRCARAYALAFIYAEQLTDALDVLNETGAQDVSDIATMIRDADIALKARADELEAAAITLTGALLYAKYAPKK